MPAAGGPRPHRALEAVAASCHAEKARQAAALQTKTCRVGFRLFERQAGEADAGGVNFVTRV